MGVMAVAMLAAGLSAAEPAPAPEQAPAEEPGAQFQVVRNLFSLLDADFNIGPWKFKGYVQADGAEYDQATPGPAAEDFRRGAIGDPSRADARALADGALLRRARLGGEGTWGEDLAYRAMFELSGVKEGAQPRIAEVWVTWRRFKPYTVTVGAFPQLAGMADATSSDSLLFLERPTAAQLARDLGAGDGRIGAMFRRATPTSMVALSFTGPVIDHAEDFTPRGAVVMRATKSFTVAGWTRVQLGGSASYVLSPAEDSAGARTVFPVRFRAQPEVKVDDTPLIDTGDLPARHANVLGLEAAAQRGSLFLQGEAFRFGVDRQEGEAGPDPHFFGWYLEGSWILTGERRRFDPSRGAFWIPTPARPLGRGGWGAWELAFRVSRMNLDFHRGAAGEPPPPDGVRGGDQRIVSLGLDWYPKPRIRFMLSWMDVRVDRLNPARALDPEPFGPPPGTPPPGAQIGQKMKVIAIRARYAF
jgi:phosphate-selective porin OprO/OprP